MTAKGVATDFGRYLQSFRKSRGISLGVVSHQTKITVDKLRQIENERLEQLPSPVFVKGFIKSFALAVGADPVEAVLRFQNRMAASECVTAQCVQKPTVSFTWKHLAVAVVLFAGLIGATLYIAEWIHQPLPTPRQSVAPSETADEASALESRSARQAAKQQTPMENDKLPASKAVEVEKALLPASKTLEIEKAPLPVNKVPEVNRALPQPVKTVTPATTPADTLELQISAVETTWFKVVVDDKIPREFLLQANQNVTLVAEREFNLTIGNAGGIRLKLNDQPVQVAGATGQVVDLRLP